MARPVTIKWVANGWIVDVGCQSFVFQSVLDLLTNLDEYLKNPDQKEKEMQVTARNMKWTNGVPVNPTPFQETDERCGVSALGGSSQQWTGSNADPSTYQTAIGVLRTER